MYKQVCNRFLTIMSKLVFDGEQLRDILVAAHFPPEDVDRIDEMVHLLAGRDVLEKEDRASFVRYAIRFVLDFMSYYPDLNAIEKSRNILIKRDSIAKSTDFGTVIAMYSQFMGKRIAEGERA